MYIANLEVYLDCHFGALSPTGSNPTGASASQPRKQQVLDLVRKFNLLLIEDDAYFYLHFDRPNRAPSYFDLEKADGGQTGRVLRFDSLR